MDVVGSFLTNDPKPGEELGIFCLQGLGEVCWQIPIVVEVLQKVLHDENLVPRPGGGGGGVRYGASV